LKKRKASNAVTSLLLLTDGQDSSSLARLPAILRDIPQTSINAFGFGADHDARVLSSIAETAQGSFTFIEKLDDVGPAFAATLGGLLSVTALDVNATVELKAPGTIEQIHTVFEHKLGDDGRSGTIQLPDMLSGESRDIVLTVSLPANDIEKPFLTGHVTYKTPGNDEAENIVVAPLIVKRPDSTRCQANITVNTQRNRVLASDALKKAAELGQKNQLEAARETLQGAIDAIEASVSKKEPLCKDLIKDLKSTKDRLASASTFQAGGYAQMTAQMNMHGRQRQTAGVSSSAYGYNAMQSCAVQSYGAIPMPKK